MEGARCEWRGCTCGRSMAGLIGVLQSRVVHRAAYSAQCSRLIHCPCHGPSAKEVAGWVPWLCSYIECMTDGLTAARPPLTVSLLCGMCHIGISSLCALFCRLGLAILYFTALDEALPHLHCPLSPPALVIVRLSHCASFSTSLIPQHSPLQPPSVDFILASDVSHQQRQYLEL